jgi:multiple antibiotic resistance protein
VFDPQLYFSTVLTLFVILDPPGLLPVFLGLTRGMPAEARRASARNAAVVAFGIICVFAVFGRFILDYLHITIEALQVSGGLLLLLVAMQLLTGSAENEALESGTNIAIVPLGIPLLAGPGSIVAMMLAVDAARGDMWGYVTVGTALVTAMFLVWVFLRFAGGIRRVLRESGTVLLTRIAGMLLAAIAVQMLADGILAFLRQI